MVTATPPLASVAACRRDRLGASAAAVHRRAVLPLAACHWGHILKDGPGLAYNAGRAEALPHEGLMDCPVRARSRPVTYSSASTSTGDVRAARFDGSKHAAAATMPMI